MFGRKSQKDKRNLSNTVAHSVPGGECIYFISCVLSTHTAHLVHQHVDKTQKGI